MHPSSIVFFLHTLTPAQWNQSFTLNIKNPETDLLRIRVYDYDHLSFDDLIGTADIPLFNLVMNAPKHDWFQLHPSKNGSIRLALTAQGFGTRMYLFSLILF